MSARDKRLDELLKKPFGERFPRDALVYSAGELPSAIYTDETFTLEDKKKMIRQRFGEGYPHFDEERYEEALEKDREFRPALYERLEKGPIRATPQIKGIQKAEDKTKQREVEKFSTREELTRAKTRIFKETLTDVEIRDLIKGKKPTDFFRLEDLNIKTLRKIAKELGSLKVKNPKGLKKEELIAEIRRIRPNIEKDFITKKGEVKDTPSADDIPQGKLEVLSVPALRKLVAKYNKDLTIPRYNDLSKEELIRQIRLRVPSLEFKPEVQQPLRSQLEAGKTILTASDAPIFTDLAVRRGAEVRLGRVAGGKYGIEGRQIFEERNIKEEDRDRRQNIVDTQDEIETLEGNIETISTQIKEAIGRAVPEFEDDESAAVFGDNFKKLSKMFELKAEVPEDNTQDKQYIDDRIEELGGYLLEDAEFQNVDWSESDIDNMEKLAKDRFRLKFDKEYLKTLELNLLGKGFKEQGTYGERLAKQVGLSVEDLQESRTLRQSLRGRRTIGDKKVDVGKRLRYITDKQLLELHRGGNLDAYIATKQLPKDLKPADVPRPKQVLEPPEVIKAMVAPSEAVITPDPKPKISVEDFKERIRKKQLEARRERKERIRVAKAIGKAKRKAEKELGE
tara:strand:+ start:747 stop:2615 length:1869 start_codon:yes stop_codon:yes gene_type:complete